MLPYHQYIKLIGPWATALRLTVCCSHNLPQQASHHRVKAELVFIYLVTTVTNVIGILIQNNNKFYFEKVFQLLHEVEHTLLPHQYLKSYYSEIYYFQSRLLNN